MKRLILSYGLIAGLVIIGVIIVSIRSGHGHVWLGYLVMLIAFSTIYVAVRQYRDDTLGGVITFSAAMLVGLGITTVASTVYVAVWEAYLAATDFAFIDNYTQSLVESLQREGASAAELQEARASADEFRAQYGNPLFRIPVTFLEVFPVGLVVAVVSAVDLRNRR